MITWERINWFVVANGLLNCAAAVTALCKGDMRFAVIFFCWGFSGLLMGTK